MSTGGENLTQEGENLYDAVVVSGNQCGLELIKHRIITGKSRPAVSGKNRLDGETTYVPNRR